MEKDSSSFESPASFCKAELMSLVLLAFVQFLQFHSSVFKLHFFFLGVFIYSDKNVINMQVGWGVESRPQKAQSRTTHAESKGPSSRPWPSSHIGGAWRGGGWGGDKKVISAKILETAKWFSDVRNLHGFITRNDTEEDMFVRHPAI